jgi:hypothetical protein
LWDHHRNIGRIAAVIDSELLRIMTMISKHFVSAEARQCPADQKAAAMAWLEAAK